MVRNGLEWFGPWAFGFACAATPLNSRFRFTRFEFPLQTATTTALEFPEPDIVVGRVAAAVALVIVRAFVGIAVIISTPAHTPENTQAHTHGSWVPPCTIFNIRFQFSTKGSGTGADRRERVPEWEQEQLNFAFVCSTLERRGKSRIRTVAHSTRTAIALGEKCDEHWSINLSQKFLRFI